MYYRKQIILLIKFSTKLACARHFESGIFICRHDFYLEYRCCCSSTKIARVKSQNNHKRKRFQRFSARASLLQLKNSFIARVCVIVTFLDIFLSFFKDEHKMLQLSEEFNSAMVQKYV